MAAGRSAALWNSSRKLGDEIAARQAQFQSSVFQVNAMHADFSVELSAEDDFLELPWRAEDGEPRYYDLKRQPELLLNIQETFDNRELGEFLAATNSPSSMLETSKCDTWTSDELSEEELIYGARCKFASYIDLVFSEGDARTYSQASDEQLEFKRYEELARTVCGLLKRAPEISAAAEFIIRRCHFGASMPEDSEMEPSGENRRHSGYGITFYLSGYGDDATEARKRWSIGLKLVENALLQISAARRQARE